VYTSIIIALIVGQDRHSTRGCGARVGSARSGISIYAPRRGSRFIPRDFGGSRNPGSEAPGTTAPDYRLPITISKKLRLARYAAPCKSPLASRGCDLFTASRVWNRNSGAVPPPPPPCLDDGQILMRNLSRDKGRPDRFSRYHSSPVIDRFIYSAADSTIQRAASIRLSSR